MNTGNNLTLAQTMPFLIERIKSKQEEIHAWLESYEGSKELPIYSSVDIRNAGFKAAVVDTNIFPAGFNNLCEHGIKDSVNFLKIAIQRRVPHCKNILIIAEEHTRNTWYLENIRILQEIIQTAEFNVKTASFLTAQPELCEGHRYIELKTATDHSVRIHCFKKILADYEAGIEKFCLIILNNDLTGGIPDTLKNSKVPIYPSIQAGWHSRQKSHHFCHANNLMTEFGKIIDVDPWMFSCLYSVIDQIDINAEPDRQKLADTANDLLKKIEKKYQEHQIKEKPFIFIKADTGTYGMSVVPIEDANEFLALNKRKRNNLLKGKGGKQVNRYLLQEGVPTIYSIDEQISEVVIYQIENNLVGGFYRSHASKDPRANLNAPGMEFKKMCPHLSKYGDCGVHHDVNVFDIYRILARIAGIAAHREIVHLEASKK